MSDGPHRSLPMRRGWKRVAEWADNQAFKPEQINNAIIPALEEDCRGEISTEFLSSFLAACRNQEGSLFKKELGPELEALSSAAGYGLGRMVLEYAKQLSGRGNTGLDIAEKAVTHALSDRAERGARQVEEHYCRKSFEKRAIKVRQRIEEAIRDADVERLARQTINPKNGESVRPPLKRQGLDDGVKL
jgi:hypothetical protein